MKIALLKESGSNPPESALVRGMQRDSIFVRIETIPIE